MNIGTDKVNCHIHYMTENKHCDKHNGLDNLIRRYTAESIDNRCDNTGAESESEKSRI